MIFLGHYLKPAVVLGLFLLNPGLSFSQNHADRFLIDGDVNDFKNVPHQVYRDTIHQPEKGMNLQEVYMAYDKHYFYIGFTSGRPLNLTGGNPSQGQVYIYLDVDQNRKTGYLTGALGAEVSIDFTRKIVRWNVKPESDVQLDQAGIRLMPTLASTTYEVAIPRQIPLESDTAILDNNISWQLTDKTGDETLPTYDSAFDYQFQGPKVVPEVKPISTNKKLQEGFRLVSHNTLNSGLINDNRATQLKRLYQYLDPAILTLNECWDVSAAKAKLFFNKHLKLPSNKEWHACKLDEGNITVSKYPFAKKWQITDSLRLTATLTKHPKQQFLLVNAHLSCCDQNTKRQAQATALMKFLKDAHQPGGKINLPEGTPILVSGDMNLVGKGITKRMLTGDTTKFSAFYPDWDYTKLKTASTPHTHGHFVYTWKSLESGWPAGKLDYIFFSNSVIQLKKHFTLNTQEVPDSLLRRTALKPSTTSLASDHYPLVADFSFIQPQQEGALIPMPSHLNQSSYNFPVKQPVNEVKIFNKTGKLVISKEPQKSLRLDMTNWQPGVYYFRIDKPQGQTVQTFLVTP